MKILYSGRNKRIEIANVCTKMNLNKSTELEIKEIEKLNSESVEFTVLVKGRIKNEA